MNEEKNRLRKSCKATAARLTDADRQKESEAITAAVTASSAFREARTVFVYLSMPDEPDTAGIIKAALADGKRVCVPVCGRPPRMDAVFLTADAILRPNSLGIPEPAGDLHTAKPSEIDLAVVPCVAAAKTGVRLGHGGGYYDAYLSRTPAKRFCLCFSPLLTPTLPAEAHDLPMDAVITGRGFLSFIRFR